MSNEQIVAQPKTLAEWLAAQEARITERQARDAKNEEDTRSRDRQNKVEQFYKMLSAWGVPADIATVSDDFPTVRIGEEWFQFQHSTYESGSANLRHMVPLEDGWHTSETRIFGSDELVMWLTGQRTHHLPYISPPKAAKPQAKLYRAAHLCDEDRLTDWLNEQAYDGFLLESMSAYGDAENGSGVWVVVRDKTAAAGQGRTP